MVKLIEFDSNASDKYIEMYNEFIKFKSDLIPDILEISCSSSKDYQDILLEINNRKAGKHSDLDWYNNGYYYLAFDDDDLIGIGCIRDNLTKKGYDIWGNIAYGVRPNKRKMGYGTMIAKLLIEKCFDLGMNEIILCHYEDNTISPKIFNKIGANYINTVNSTVSIKKIKRYRIVNPSN